jgi:hypothetical protein
VREMIYASPAKIRQFMAASPRRFGDSELNAGPSLMSIKSVIRRANDDGLDHQVFRAIDRIAGFLDDSPTTRWYGERGVRPGEWVQFDGFMSANIVTAEAGSLAFFGHEGGQFLGDVALLLYGSPRNLVQMQEGATVLTPHHLDSMPFALAEFLDSLGYDEETDETRTFDEADRYGGAAEFFERLGRSRHRPVARGDMKGYARVVDVQEHPRIFVHPDGFDGSWSPSRLVVASPLFVEYLRG